MADAARDAAEQKARSELGSLQGKFDFFFDIEIWNAPTLEGNDCCLAGYSSAIFATFFVAGPQKAGRSGEGATERGRTVHRKVVLF